MPISVQCGGCGRALRVADTLAGKAIRCPQCQTPQTVPAGVTEAAPAPRPRPAAAVTARPAPPEPRPAPLPAPAQRQPPQPPARRRPAAAAVGVPWFLYALGGLPLGLVAVQMVAAASGGGPLWDGAMRFLWLGLGAGPTIIIMGLARLPNLAMGVKVGVGVGLDVLAYGVFVIVVLVRMGPSSPSLTNPDTWTTFAPPEGRFSVSFPGEPEKKTATIRDNIQATYFTVDRKREKELFIAFYYDLPYPLQRPGADALLDEEKGGMIDTVKDRKAARSNPITLAGRFQGREVHVERHGDGLAVGRLYYVQGRMYGLLLLGGRSQLSEGPLSKFLDSFKLVGEPPPAAGPDETGPFRSHDGAVRCLDVAPTGDLLATGGQDGNVMLWDVNTGKRTQILADGHPRGVHRVAFAADGKTLASIGPFGVGGLNVWRPGEAKPIYTFKEQGEFPEYLAVSPDGTLVATAWRNQVWLFDVPGQKKLPRIQTPHNIKGLTFHSDGKTVFIGTDQGEIHMVNALTRKGRKPVQCTRGWAHCLALSRDGNNLAIGAADGLEVVEFPSRQRRTDFDGLGKAGVVSVAFSPDGTRLAFVQNDRATVWDLRGRKKLGDVPEKQRVEAVFFHPDGNRVIVRSGDDIRLHEVAKLN